MVSNPIVKIEAIQEKGRIDRIKGMVTLAAGAAILGGYALHENAQKKDAAHTDTTSAPAITAVATSTPEKIREPKVKGTPIVPFVPNGKDDRENMISFNNYWEKTSLEALEIFRDADPIMPRLIEFTKQNAVYPVAQGPVATMRVLKDGEWDKPPSPHEFEIVFMPEQYAAKMRSSVQTEPDGHTMRVAATFQMKEWLGIILAHELSHIYALQIQGENPFSESEWLGGEVKAHKLEAKLLRHWNPQMYDEMLQKMAHITRTIANPHNEIDQLEEEYYPITSNYVGPREKRLAAASIVTSTSFDLARAQGATDENLKGHYQKIVQFLKSRPPRK